MKLILSISAAALLLTGASSQASVTYHVSVDTSSLSAPGPLALDFQLFDGNTNSNITNTASIGNFSFGGGSATNNPAATGFDNGSGSLFGTVSLTDDSAHPYSEFYQGFAPGSLLKFDVTLTTNVNPVAPDGFSFAILDNNLNNLPTNDPTGTDKLMHVDITSAAPAAVYSSGTAPNTVTAVPEPVTGVFGLALAGVLGLTRRHRRPVKRRP